MNLWSIPRRRLLLPLAAAPASLAPSPALGQDGQAAPAPIEVVVTGTRTPESAQRATVRTGVVTREEAERRGATNVGDALSGELGVSVNPSAYDYLGGPSAVQLQGFDQDRVLVLEDGERVIGDVGGAIDLSTMPLADVDRVEYVLGPSSSLYGTSALGGAVNVITAAPPYEGPSGRLRLEGRSHRGLLLDASGAFRRTESWAAADLSYRRSDGVRLDPDEPDLAVPDSERRLLGLRLGTTLNRRAELTLRARWIHDESQGLLTQEFPGVGRFVVDTPERTDRVALRLGNRLRLGGNAWLTLSLSQQWFDGESVTDRRDSPVDETRLRSDELQSFEATALVPVADSRGTLVLGARVERERFAQRLTRVSASSQGLVSTEIEEVLPTTLASAAAYAQLGWALGGNVTVMPGVRLETHRRFGSVVAPRLAGAWQPSDDLRFRASGGRGFRAPSAKEFGFFFDHSFLGYRVIGNPELVPERSWGVSGDVSFVPQPDLRLRAGAFANWVDDLIDIELASTQPSPGVTDYRYVNVGKARTSGVDLSGRIDVGPGYRAELGYAFLWTRDDTRGRPLPSRPPHTLQAAVTVRLPARLDLYVRWRAVSAAFVDVDVTAPGFETLDARLGRRLLDELSAYAGVLNLLDARKDPRRAGDERPALGRVFYLGLSAELPSEV